MVFNRFSELCNNRKLNAWNHTFVVIVHGQYNKQSFENYFTPVLFDFLFLSLVVKERNLVREKMCNDFRNEELCINHFILCLA